MDYHTTNYLGVIFLNAVLSVIRFDVLIIIVIFWPLFLIVNKFRQLTRKLLS